MNVGASRHGRPQWLAYGERRLSADSGSRLGRPRSPAAERHRGHLDHTRYGRGGRPGSDHHVSASAAHRRGGTAGCPPGRNAMYFGMIGAWGYGRVGLGGVEPRVTAAVGIPAVRLSRRAGGRVHGPAAVPGKCLGTAGGDQAASGPQIAIWAGAVRVARRGPPGGKPGRALVLRSRCRLRFTWTRRRASARSLAGGDCGARGGAGGGAGQFDGDHPGRGTRSGASLRWTARRR